MSGSPDNSAAKAAQQQETQRQAIIASTQARVNDVFNNPRRQRDISDFVSAVRERAMQDLNRQQADASRELTFALARGGQIGGSVNNDQNRRLADEYNRGLIAVENRALGAGSEVEAADQDSRARLVQLATSGLDAATGAQQASAAMRSSIGSAQADAYGQQLGDQFTTIGNFVKQRRDENTRRQAVRDAHTNLYGSNGYGG